MKRKDAKSWQIERKKETWKAGGQIHNDYLLARDEGSSCELNINFFLAQKNVLIKSSTHKFKG